MRVSIASTHERYFAKHVLNALSSLEHAAAVVLLQSIVAVATQEVLSSNSVLQPLLEALLLAELHESVHCACCPLRFEHCAMIWVHKPSHSFGPDEHANIHAAKPQKKTTPIDVFIEPSSRNRIQWSALVVQYLKSRIHERRFECYATMTA